MNITAMFDAIHHWFVPIAQDGAMAALLERERKAEGEARVAMDGMKSKRLSFDCRAESTSQLSLEELGDNVVDLDQQMREALGRDGK